MLKVACVSAAVLGTYSGCCRCADALQSSPTFPQTPRYNIAHGYLDSEHPYTYDPNSFDIGSSVDLSEEMRMDAPNGMQRTVQASVETNVSREYSYQIHSNPPHFTPSPPLEEMDDDYEMIPRRPKRTTFRRRSRLASRSRGSSILSTRRKPRALGADSSSSDLLTFEEEKQIASDIQSFRSVTRARDNLVEWMSREINPYGGSQQTEPDEYQWASSCSISVDQLHHVVARGQEARTKLIRGNVGLVTMVAKRYYNMIGSNGTGRSPGGGAAGTDATLKLDDLIQEGYMGIMEAAERFDPSKGYRFSTYGTHWIKQRILRSVAESSRMIRLPVHVQTTIRNMNKKRKELEAMSGRRPSLPELAHEMGVAIDKVQMWQHLSKNVLSLELPVDRHDVEDKRTLGDRVACTEFATPDEDIMSESLRGEVHTMLDALGHEERLVLTHRFGLEDGRPKSMRETADGMGISSDRIRTIEAKALNKLRQPRMNYRLKDYVGSDAFGGESDYAAEPFHQDNFDGMHSNGMVNGEEEQQQQHYYHYPHHMNPARMNAYDHARDDDLGEYERPTPESIWSF